MTHFNFFATSHKTWRRSNTTSQQAGYHEANMTTKETLTTLDSMTTALEQDRQTALALSSNN